MKETIAKLPNINNYIIGNIVIYLIELRSPFTQDGSFLLFSKYGDILNYRS